MITFQRLDRAARRSVLVALLWGPIYLGIYFGALVLLLALIDLVVPDWGVLRSLIARVVGLAWAGGFVALPWSPTTDQPVARNDVFRVGSALELPPPRHPWIPQDLLAAQFGVFRRIASVLGAAAILAGILVFLLIDPFLPKRISVDIVLPTTLFTIVCGVALVSLVGYSVRDDRRRAYRVLVSEKLERLDVSERLSRLSQLEDEVRQRSDHLDQLDAQINDTMNGPPTIRTIAEFRKALMKDADERARRADRRSWWLAAISAVAGAVVGRLLQ